MEKNKLRHMSRRELLEIIYALQEKEQELNEEIDSLREKLEDRNIRIRKAGSIAEAACDLNEIFRVAQNTADQYLESLRSQYGAAENIVALAQRKADRILAEAREKAGNSEN